MERLGNMARKRLYESQLPRLLKRVNGSPGLTGQTGLVTPTGGGWRQGKFLATQSELGPPLVRGNFGATLESGGAHQHK